MSCHETTLGRNSKGNSASWEKTHKMILEVSTDIREEVKNAKKCKCKQVLTV